MGGLPECKGGLLECMGGLPEFSGGLTEFTQECQSRDSYVGEGSKSVLVAY